MKAKPRKNTISKTGPWTIVAIFVILLLVGGLIGIYYCYEKLRAIWDERSTIIDPSAQITIRCAQNGLVPRMVTDENIMRLLDLKEGALLSRIDYGKKREHLLASVPNLKDVRITRQVPDRVTVFCEERTPIVRLSFKESKETPYRVADTEGVVFECVRGTANLPIIREPSKPGTTKGKKLEGRAMAALHLAEACQSSTIEEFSLKEIDVSTSDWLTAKITVDTQPVTLKIAWEGMDEPETPAIRANLIRQLTNLRAAMRSPASAGVVIWNAYDFSRPGKIYGDTKGKL